MKKKMQKYLSGSNEGFSLVELIIVIAIMAILVGVVALAVIPNLERSRESKDLTTLDNVAAALATSVATAGSGAKTNDDFPLTDIKTGVTGDAVKEAMLENLGDCTNVKLVCAAATSGSSVIKCKYDTTNNTLEVYADPSAKCKYQKGDDGQPRDLKVVK